MRVLVMTPTFFPIVGGAELLVLDILTELSARHEVRLLTPHLPESSAGFWVDGAYDEAAMGFTVQRFEDRVSMMKLRGHGKTRGLIPPVSISGMFALRREIRRFRPDVVLNFFGVPFGLGGVAVAKLSRVPFALVFCGTDLPTSRLTVRLPHWADYLRLAKNASDAVVYVSKSCRIGLDDGPWRPNEHVIHGGVRLAEFRDRDGAAVRERLALSPDDIMLFALQRLGPEKRVDVLVQAMALLRPRDQRVKLVIGGQGSESDSLRALVEQLDLGDTVEFAGYLGDEKAEYFAAADVFVFHSLFETFGQVLAEAMAAGKPVVSVRAGSIPEVVDEGVTGLLAEPEDPFALADQIDAMIDDPELRARAGRAGYARAERMFDWDGQARRWEGLLEATADGTRTVADARTTPDTRLDR